MATKKVSSDNLEDVESLLYYGYLEEDVFIGDYCLSLRSLSSAEERELWLRYKNVRPSDQVYFVVDLLGASLHRVNGMRIENLSSAREFFWRLPRQLLLGLYRFFRSQLGARLTSAQDAVSEYAESPSSRSLWSAFKVTGTMPSPEFDFCRGNVVQHIWLVLNDYKDKTESERAEWDRSEYLADRVCMFINPKGFKQMAAARESSKQVDRAKEYDAETDVLIDTLDMMPPDERSKFIDAISATEAEQLTMFLDKIPRGSLESVEDYKQRVCDAMAKAAALLETRDSLHAETMATKAEDMVLRFMRTLRGRLAVRNLKIMLEIMGPQQLEMASQAVVIAESDLAVVERGTGYAIRPPSDRALYDQIMQCQGEYKHCGFVPFKRRAELLDQILTESLFEHARLVMPDVDPYLLRKANLEGDGPRTSDDGPPRPPPKSGPDPLTQSRATSPADARAAMGDVPRVPQPASDRPEVADQVSRLAEEYRQRHPGIDDVAGKIEIGEHVVETLGDWESTAMQKLEREAPRTVDEATERAKETVQEIRQHGLEEPEEQNARRDSALDRRNEAIERLERAKRQSGMTPGQERTEFLEDIKRIAQGQQPLNKDMLPESPRPEGPEEPQQDGNG